MAFNFKTGLLSSLCFMVFFLGCLRAQPTIVAGGVNGVLSPVAATVYPGQSNTMTGIFQDNGDGISYVFFDFEVWPSASYSCKVGVQLVPQYNVAYLYLHDDMGNPLPSMTPGSTRPQDVQQNSKCILFAAGSSVSQSGPQYTAGTQYTVNVQVQFKDPYNGVKYLYLNAYEASVSRATGWQSPSAQAVVQSADYAPVPVSVAPASGLSALNGTQSFQVTISDANGAFTMWHVEFMLSPEGGGWLPGYDFQPTQRCKVVAEASANEIWIEGDSENAMVSAAVAFNSPGPPIANNGRCTLIPSMTTESYADINTIVLTFTVSFQSALIGPMQSHMFIADNLGQQVWDAQSNGTWNWTVSSSGSQGNHEPQSSVSANYNVPRPINRTNAAWANLNDCYNSGSATCSLPDGPIAVPSTLYIQRSNFQLSGVRAQGGSGGIPSGGTVLLRSPALGTMPIISINGAPDSPISGVVLQNLTISGCAQEASDTTNLDYVADCSRFAGFASPSRIGTPQLPPVASSDISISDVSGVSGAGVTMENINLVGAPGDALDINSSSSGITFDGGVIAYSSRTGIHADGLALPGDTPVNFNTCDQPNWKSGNSLHMPTNLIISNSLFTDNFTGALGLQTFDTVVSNNRFINNYLDPHFQCSALSPDNYCSANGGSVFFDQCSDGITLSGNTLVGPSSYGETEGLELHGRNITVSGGEISGFPLTGIVADSVFVLKIQDGAYIHDNDWRSGSGFYTGGIAINNVSGQRVTDGVSIKATTSGNTSGFSQAWGVAFPQGNANNGTLNHIVIDDSNNFSGNAIKPVCQFNNFVSFFNSAIAFPVVSAGNCQ